MKKSIFAVALLLSVTELNSQVTIGSSIPPAQGALLDLKSHQNGTSSKGLGLPRVEVKDLNKLIMGNTNLHDVPDAKHQREAHTGLLVYNVYEEICTENPFYSGLYVWTGENWDGINTEKDRAMASTVEVLVDNRDPNDRQEYLTGLFNGRRWMLENLRAKTWDAKRNNPKESKATLPSLTGPAIHHKTVASWAYPIEDGKTFGTGVDVTDSRIYDERPEFGILYNHLAASSHKKETAQEGGGANPKEKFVQGICPYGWHLPTDKEWTDLEIEIIQNTPKYTYTSQPIANAPETDGLTYENTPDQSSASTARGNKHGLAMRGRCEIKEGNSFGASQNGFVLTLTGHVYSAGDTFNIGYYGLGSTSFLWTSSHSSGGAYWYRRLDEQAKGIVRSTAGQSYMFNVRCVENY